MCGPTPNWRRNLYPRTCLARSRDQRIASAGAMFARSSRRCSFCPVRLKISPIAPLREPLRHLPLPLLPEEGSRLTGGRLASSPPYRGWLASSPPYEGGVRGGPHRLVPLLTKEGLGEV